MQNLAPFSSSLLDSNILSLGSYFNLLVIVILGADAAEVFLKHMIEEEQWILNKIWDPRKLIMTEADRQNFAAASVCYMCDKAFSADNKGDKCRDHCHLSGIYRGAAHR